MLKSYYYSPVKYFLEPYMKRYTSSKRAVFSQVWRRSIFKFCVHKLAEAVRFLKFKWEFVIIIIGRGCLVLPETHKGLKRVTRVQCSWIFTFTIFGNLSVRYPFSKNWLPRDHLADVLRQEFSISRLKIHR